jgi:hypothetical protein
VSLISAGPESPSDVVIPEFNGNQTTDLLVTARDLVASLETRGGGDRRQTDAIEAINTSIEEYRADVFASSKDAYVAKKDAFTSLQPLANRGGNGGQAAEAQSKLATASNVSSRLALRQAVAAVRDHESELSSSQQNKASILLKRLLSHNWTQDMDQQSNATGRSRHGCSSGSAISGRSGTTVSRSHLRTARRKQSISLPTSSQTLLPSPRPRLISVSSR